MLLRHSIHISIISLLFVTKYRLGSLWGFDLVIVLRCIATRCNGWSETECVWNWVQWLCLKYGTWWKGSWNGESWWCCRRELLYRGSSTTLSLAMCLPRPVGESFWRINADSLCSSSLPNISTTIYQVPLMQIIHHQ